MDDNDNSMLYSSSLIPDCIKMVPHIDPDGMIEANCYLAEQMAYNDPVGFMIPQLHSLYNTSKYDANLSQVMHTDASYYTTPVNSQLNKSYQNSYIVSPPFITDQKGAYSDTQEDMNVSKYLSPVSPRIDIGKNSRQEKSNKGLRHFSMKVLQKVEEKKVTTYNEVADDLVREFGNRSADPEKQSYEQKNIRRRVYDALNVLMAMKIIHKEKKDIRWVGLPSNNEHESQRLNEERNRIGIQVEEKIKKLRDLVLQTVCIQQLLKENKEKRARGEVVPDKNKLDLPFAAVITSNCNTVDCTVSESRSELTLEFKSNFDVVDETQLLRHMGFSGGLESGVCNFDEISLYRSFSPGAFHPFIDVFATFSPQESVQLILTLRNCLMDEKNQGDTCLGQTLFLTKLIESCVQRRNSVPVEDYKHLAKAETCPENGSSLYQSNAEHNHIN